MAKEIYLTQYGLMAERHWREFLPEMVREMEAKGTLMEALFEAQERTIEEMEVLTRQFETEQKMTPQQAHDRAWEMIAENTFCFRRLMQTERPPIWFRQDIAGPS